MKQPDPTPKLTTEELEFVEPTHSIIRRKAFEQAARRLDLFVAQYVSEVKNDIGGVIGYTLSLDIDQTRELWNLFAKSEEQADG